MSPRAPNLNEDCKMWFFAFLLSCGSPLAFASLDQKKFYANLLNDPYAGYPGHDFVSSRIIAPTVNISQHSAACEDGLYYLITPTGSRVPRPGPMILDSNGTVIWSGHFENEFGSESTDLKVQQCK